MVGTRKVAEVRSFTTAEKVYVIKAFEDGIGHTCTCPAWRFQRKPITNRTCKHIEDYLSHLRYTMAG